MKSRPIKVVAAFLVLCAATGCTKGIKKTYHLKRADSYFEKGEYDKAKIAYLKVLQSDGQNARAIQQIGLIWWEQGVPLQAIPFLTWGCELAPDNLDTRTKLALASLTIGRAAEARAEATKILEKSPRHEEAIMLLAESARTDEEVAETEALLKNVAPPELPAVHLARAVFLLRKNDTAGAEKAVQAALALNPDSLQALSAWANLSWMKKDLNGAEQAVKRAAELSPPRSAARVRYAQFKFDTKATGEAESILKEITDKAPDYIPAWRTAAQMAFSLKKYDDALRLLENVLGRDPRNLEARLLESQIQLAKGNKEKALESLKSLDISYPGYPVLKFHLARACVANGAVNEAIAALNDAVRLNPKYTEAIMMLADLNIHNGKAADAIAPMKELLAEHPDFPPAKILLAQALAASGDFDGSANLLREFVKSSPDNGQAHLLLGLALRQQGKQDEARLAFEKAEKLGLKNAVTLSELVDLDLAKKDFDAAFARVKAQADQTPNVPTVHFLNARILAAQKKWDEAIAALNRCLELDANFSRAYNLLVQIHLAKRDLPGVAAELEKGLEKSPQSPTGYMLLGMVYLQLKEHEKAKNAFEKALEIAPNTASALNNLAWLHTEFFNDPRKGRELAAQAKLLQPNDPQISDTLGWAQYKLGEYQQAFELLQEAAGRLPGEAVVQYHLGMAAYSMGKAGLAKSALELALKEGPEYPGKDEAERRLGEIERGVQPGGQPGVNTPALSVDELTKAIAERPDDPILSLRLGQAYEKENAFVEAAASYQRALKLNPRLREALDRLIALNEGPLAKPEEALKLAKKAREISPQDPQANATLGRLAFKSGDHTWGYGLLQEAFSRLPDTPQIRRDLAWAAYSMGKVEDARQIMTPLTVPEVPEKFREEAGTFLALSAPDSDPDRLLPEAEKALETDPHHAPALMIRAAAKAKAGDSKSATADYSEVLRQFPQFVPAQKALAALYAQNPETAGKAWELAMKARKALPDDLEVAATLAQLSYAKKDYKYTIQLLEESGRKHALDARGLYYLGMSQWNVSKGANGRDALSRAVSAGLPDPMVAEAKRLLEEPQEAEDGKPPMNANGRQ
jgi:tetratricopeptide (TPR) repeat protein